MAWLSWAVDDPAPAANAGYFTGGAWVIPQEVDAAQKAGAVIHSAAGNWNPPGYKPSDLMRSRGNSWDATIMLNGEVWRHRPRPTFCNWHAGGPAQNIALCGFEMEGTGPWTAAQKASIVRVIEETWAYFGWARFVMAGPTNKTQEGIRQAILAIGKGGAYEHDWLDYTSCPNGRDDWAWLTPAAIAAIAEEADMTPEDMTELKRYMTEQVLAIKRDINEFTTSQVLAIESRLAARLDALSPSAAVDIVAVAQAVRAEFERDPLK